ncbi:hypothetical protein L3X38_027009 [Prunus dulcis]|uniref:Uncharacterized protein n=1 Tax=Prunus dulcis TaxID=3755 RepID=A0AAD4VNC0_PRUDU|nr:hypothetical protein L3X38_027009 [Prunus dulcis]
MGLKYFFFADVSAYLALGLAGLDVGAFLLGWAVRWNCFIAPSIYHPSHPLESIRPKKSFPNPISSKGPRIKRGLISYSTLPHVPSIARLLSAVRYCSVAATSSIRSSGLKNYTEHT